MYILFVILKLYMFVLQAGQVYGVPLTGNLLSKPGFFPEQKASGEDFRKKWIEVCLFSIHVK